MKIIDFRFRPNTKEFLGAFISPNGPIRPFKKYIDWYNMSLRLQALTNVDILVDNLKKMGLVHCIVPATDIETKWGLENSNKEVAKLVDSHPEFFIGFAGVDPHKGMRGINDLRFLLTELGLRGVDYPPFLNEVYANDKKCFPIYELCVELNLPICIHTSFSFDQAVKMDYGHPKYIDEVATLFPDLKIVCNHFGYPWIKEMITVAWRHPNVYIEISGAYPQYLPPELIQFINTPILQDKTLYGSSFFFLDYERCLQEITQIGLKKNILNKVLYGNAAGLLELDISTKK